MGENQKAYKTKVSEKVWIYSADVDSHCIWSLWNLTNETKYILKQLKKKK